MLSNRFYLACIRDNVGSNVAFHCREGRGYSTNLDMAETFSREDAQRAWDRGREFDQPLCADRVDALTVHHVDCQCIPAQSEIVEGCTRYVAYQKSRWNGNDVYWLRDNGMPATDFAKATVYEQPGDGDELVWMPFEMADSVKRRTIDSEWIDRRRMVQAAGLTTPSQVKRCRRSKDSGKTRWNCPSCGRISWQYNPYEFDGCGSLACEHWKPAVSYGL